MIQQKRTNLAASACVNGLEEATRPLMSKAKNHRKIKSDPRYTINKVANCLLDGP